MLYVNYISIKLGEKRKGKYNYRGILITNINVIKNISQKILSAH